MSSGLGAMQRRILDALAVRLGGDRVDENHIASFGLALGVHDLRQVSKAMARDHGGIYNGSFVTGKWQASFSRAVAGLVARGYISAPSLVPLADVGQSNDGPLRRQVHHLSDGAYIDQPRQRRFVRVMYKGITAKGAA